VLAERVTGELEASAPDLQRMIHLARDGVLVEQGVEELKAEAQPDRELLVLALDAQTFSGRERDAGPDGAPGHARALSGRERRVVVAGSRGTVPGAAAAGARANTIGKYMCQHCSTFDTIAV